MYLYCNWYFDFPSPRETIITGSLIPTVFTNAFSSGIIVEGVVKPLCKWVFPIHMVLVESLVRSFLYFSREKEPHLTSMKHFCKFKWVSVQTDFKMRIFGDVPKMQQLCNCMAKLVLSVGVLFCATNNTECLRDLGNLVLGVFLGVVGVL